MAVNAQNWICTQQHRFQQTTFLNASLRLAVRLLVVLWIVQGLAVHAGNGVDEAILQRRWYEMRSSHFTIYTCADGMAVQGLATRLEQYHDAYSMLAGAQAVASPPIIVLAFPDHESLMPYLPIYQGQPANLAGFFNRGNDQNLIVMSFAGTNAAALDVIFHEYSHLLFRRNQNIWPLWLSEGMAEMYSTFEAGVRSVQIGKPIVHHLKTLSQNSLIPLDALMDIAHDSPEYNERERQGVFYAESWMLTHFLMNGDNPALKSRFGQFTKLLRDGEPPQKAFTNSLKMSFTTVEAELHRYLERGVFEPVNYVVPGNLNTRRVLASRPLTPVETAFWLGNELFRINRLEDARAYFDRGVKIAPNSPLGYEGLGLIAAEKDKHAEAVRLLKSALERNSTSFIAHSTYAHERLLMETDGAGNFKQLDNTLAEELRSELVKSLVLMPNYAMAHQLLGIVQLSRGQNLDEAEQHFQRVLELQPENQSCQLSLAEVKWKRNDNAGAKAMLTILAASAKSPEVRKNAAELLKAIK